MRDFTSYQTLNAMEVPLDGVNLVEANAGTGKTYNIVSLYLRLLLESSLKVDQILVVSFTEAATAELRERIRKRLRELQTVFETGSGTAEELSFLNCCADQSIGLRQLIRALQSFDQAAIYTIHGFCQRLLSDCAFEAGLSQATTLITDDNALRRQLIDDFWHSETSNGSRLWVQYLLDESPPETLYTQLAKYFSRPLTRRLAPAQVVVDPALEEEFAGIVHRLQDNWAIWRLEIGDILLTDKGLSQVSYNPKTLDKFLSDVDDWVYAGGVSFGKLKKIKKLGAATIISRTKKKFTPPKHIVFDLFQQLLDLAGQLEPLFAPRLAHMRRRLLEFADVELIRRKQEQRVRHFDDLLGELYTALQSSQAAALQKSATRQYHAALIDEFQDTDPLQFAIFDFLFCAAGTPVFFVGDPKQAIYGFRGADVFAYLEARERATGRYRLELNYRSTPRLVDSVNTVFQQNKNPFVIDAIDFHPSAAAHDHSGLRIDGTVQPAMQWWHVPEEDIAAADCDIDEMIAGSVATKIADLLLLVQQGKVTKPENKPLEAGDIAVLVNSHKQGRLVRDALGLRGISCMQRTEDNVFQSSEADELYIIMRAVVEPARYSLVRAALATELLGYDAAQIDALEQADNQWQDLLDRFASYPETWRRHGFSRMFRRITQEFSVELRLLARADGQRRVTNLLHAADLLQRESSRRRGGLEEVLIWMQEQRQIERPDDQTMLLRLESDEDLVNIMTVHFSKGLQFPVVFCPFLWNAGTPPVPDLPEFHDEHNRACLDLAVERNVDHKLQVDVEKLAERVRLAYVALTRAELACWAVWGTKGRHIQSSLNWLLLPPHDIADEPLTVAVKKMQARGSSEIAERLRSIQSHSLQVAPMPAPTTRRLAIRGDAATVMQPRMLKHEIARGWRVSSFSAMTRHAVEEPRDYDAGKSSEQPVETEPQGIFAFARGARAGRCMHELLENIAFDADGATIEETARQTLVAYGFDPAHAAVLTTMALNVLSTSLSKDTVLRLCDVKPVSRVVEMEFYFPITAIDAGQLRTTLGEFGAGTAIEKRLAQLEFRVGDGFMHGFIDLVFEADNRYYLVDYKSNWLGSDSADYHLERLHTEIARHDYYLQYLIYSLALHRYLQQKLPEYDYESHFGGAYYLFLRGMHPDHGPDYGVFHDRPDCKLIQRLDQLFGRATKQ